MHILPCLQCILQISPHINFSQELSAFFIYLHMYIYSTHYRRIFQTKLNHLLWKHLLRSTDGSAGLYALLVSSDTAQQCTDYY